MTHREIPHCIGIIPDGNRRWAKAHGVSIAEGHKRGMEKGEEVAEWMSTRGIDHLIFYAFSTENWNRSKEEVDQLMQLFEHGLSDSFSRMKEMGARVRFIGERDRFSAAMQEKMRTLEETSDESARQITIALSYGGRNEIVRAVNRALARGDAQVDEESFAALLDTAGIPDPDIIIRTSGEQRLSNFLPWQSTYSELFFTELLWPDFTEKEFDRILQEYSARQRRRGK